MLKMPPKRTKIKYKEKDTQSAILDYLRATKAHFIRNNTGAFKTERGGFVRFGTVGSPDILIFRKGMTYGVEVKSTGRKQSPEQIEWQKRFEKEGFIYILAYNLDDFLNKYN